MSQVLQSIREVHRSTWRLTAALTELSQRLDVPVASPDIELLRSILDYIERYVEQVHRPMKLAYLYRVVRLHSAEAAELIDDFEREHAASPALLLELREQLGGLNQADSPTLGAFCTALDSYAKLLQRHIAREQTVLFPIARSALGDADWKQIDAAFQAEQSGASGQAARAEFRSLMSRIVSLAAAPIGPDLNLLPEIAAPSETNLLEIRQLYSHYGRIAALPGADLALRTGRLVALVGANGAGKTTLLRTISGVQKATSGSIRFDGRDITHMAADQRVRLGICQVPEGRQVFGPLSVADNLRLGAFTGSDETCIKKDLQRMYDMFPVLKHRSHEPAGTLSGGQQQMLAIARALMGRPRLLLLDEPSMGLAPLLLEEIFRAIVELRRQSITILLVEQNAHLALAIADDAFVMETGRIVMAGSARELLADERVREAYLGL